MLTGFLAVIAAAAAVGVGAACADTSSPGQAASGTGTAVPSPITTSQPSGVAPAPSGPPVGTPDEQVHPRVRPASGSRRTPFAVSFTLRARPGHQGVLASDYRVQVDAPRCQPPMPRIIDTGVLDSTVRIPLSPPAHGWCIGRHRITVFLQRGPYCPRPAAGQPPTPCPEFATQDLDVGETHFTVRRARR